MVVNVSSTEPSGRDGQALPKSCAGPLNSCSASAPCPLPASSLYAIAALDLGCRIINFTPSLGATPPAMQELAGRAQNAPRAARTARPAKRCSRRVLAPMFADRNLEVMSWVGHNIFGNCDGLVLDDPANKASKIKTQGPGCCTRSSATSRRRYVSIEYIASMGDWKTAWDHIHFKGFLGTTMMLQFIWQGCDSLLAAPLVLDLVRFTERAWRSGEVGVMTFLGSFFKSPLGIEEHDFARQFQMLEQWVEQWRG